MISLQPQAQATLHESGKDSVCVEHMDKLYYSKGADAVYEYVGPLIENIHDPEVLWRYGRACGVMYKCLVEDRQQKTEVVKKGLRAVERAMEIYPAQNSHCIHVRSRYDTLHC